MAAEVLTTSEIDRYQRQLILRGWSSEFQSSLKSLTVLIPAQYPSLCFYLLGAGVGNILISGEPSKHELLHARQLNSISNIEIYKHALTNRVHYAVFSSRKEESHFPEENYHTGFAASLTVEPNSVILLRRSPQPESLTYRSPTFTTLTKHLPCGTFLASIIIEDTRRLTSVS